MGHHGAIVPYSTSVKALLLNTLEVVIFGEKSCNETTLTTLRLVDAPLLRVVRIGGNSFCYAGSFVVKKLPVLEAVVVGEWCFAKRGNGTSLTIQDCPALTEVCVGSHAMEEWKKWRAAAFRRRRRCVWRVWGVWGVERRLLEVGERSHWRRVVHEREEGGRFTWAEDEM